MGQKQTGQLQIVEGVGVYIQASKETFTIGDFLEGSVYLKTQGPTTIDSIKVRFQCQESTSFVNRAGQQNTVYSVNGSPYEHSFEIQSFKKSQSFEGNHVFPFKFLLPSELSGSISLGSESYLRYILSGEVRLSGSASTIKSNDYIIHLTQPFRSEVHPISESTTNYPQCCECCQSYGTVYTKISSNKNLIKAGQEIKIEAQIDAQHARVPIRSWAINLNMHIFKGSPEGQKQHTLNKNFQIGSFSAIQNGQKKSVSVTKTIPTNFSQHSTSFGTILGVYYSIDISSQMGLFSKGANISIPVFYVTSSPLIDKNLKLQTSSFSSPKTYPLYTYKNMKAYIYRPAQGMPLLNRKNFNPENNLFTMNKTYMTSEGKQDHIYQIKKTRIVTNDNILNPDDRNRADPNPSQQKQANNKNERKKKYMDEENQDDYGQFKDFRSDDKGFWGQIIDIILKK